MWCTNENEFYDLKVSFNVMKDSGSRLKHALTTGDSLCSQLDPYQTTNIIADSATSEYQLENRPLKAVLNRLNALMMVLKSCKGADQCTNGWSFLHPNGQVESLKDALDEKYDGFYSSQPSVAFDQCTPGYFPALEGPQVANQYTDDGRPRRKSFDYGGNFHLFT